MKCSSCGFIFAKEKITTEICPLCGGKRLFALNNVNWDGHNYVAEKNAGIIIDNSSEKELKLKVQKKDKKGKNKAFLLSIRSKSNENVKIESDDKVVVIDWPDEDLKFDILIKEEKDNIKEGGKDGIEATLENGIVKINLVKEKVFASFAFFKKEMILNVNINPRLEYHSIKEEKIVSQMRLFAAFILFLLWESPVLLLKHYGGSYLDGTLWLLFVISEIVIASQMLIYLIDKTIWMKKTLLTSLLTRGNFVLLFFASPKSIDLVLGSILIFHAYATAMSAKDVLRRLSSVVFRAIDKQRVEKLETESTTNSAFEINVKKYIPPGYSIMKLKVFDNDLLVYSKVFLIREYMDPQIKHIAIASSVVIMANIIFLIARIGRVLNVNFSLAYIFMFMIFFQIVFIELVTYESLIKSKTVEVFYRILLIAFGATVILLLSFIMPWGR